MPEHLHAVYLALMQGFTEFLPISSSGHLILLPRMVGWADQGLAFDVAVHVGTLLAVVFYFRKDLLTLAVDWGKSISHRQRIGDSSLAWALIWATAPVAVAGLLLHDLIESQLRTPLVIAITTVAFGILLWVADIGGRRERSEHQIGWRDIIIIGLAQAVALIPGTSRSGITMTAGLLLGLTREAAARFSFLLSIPVILLAGSYQTMKLVESQQAVDWAGLSIGVGVSAVTAWLCIFLFLKMISRIGMLPFVLYRFALGGLLFYLIWFRPGFF